MIVEGYSIDAYCDGGSDWHSNDVMQTVAGKNRASCRQQLKALGWLLGKETQLCPKCAAASKHNGKMVTAPEKG